MAKGLDELIRLSESKKEARVKGVTATSLSSDIRIEEPVYISIIKDGEVQGRFLSNNRYESMKCCGNCKYWDINCYPNVKGIDPSDKCDKWEFDE